MSIPKHEQLPIPGTEPPKIKAIETAAEAYVDLREEFQKASAKVQEAKTKLVQVMQANLDKLGVNADGDKVYTFDERLVILSDKVTAKVRNLHEDADED